MAEDTGTLVAETSTETEAAPLEETAADESAVEETVAEETETPAGVSEEDIAERIKAAVAEREAEWEEQRKGESYRREQTQAEQELNAATFGKVDNLIAWVAKQIDDGKTVAEIQQIRNPMVVQNIVNPLAAAVFSQQWEAQRTHFDDYVSKAFPDWKPSQESAKKLQQAVVSRDPAKLIRAHWDYMADAIKSVEVPKGVEAALKAEKEKARPAKAVAKEQQADEMRSAPRPSTGTGGGAGLAIGSFNAAAAAYNKGQITGKQYAEYAKQYGVPID